MKATQRDFAAVAPRAVASAKVFFFCGPDEAGASAAAQTVVSLLADPGERIDLSGAELRRDPVRLGDEARSVSLFGESRHIMVRAQGDEAHDAVENLLASDVPACPVLIVATGATDKSRTAKLLAARSDALVAMFWPPDVKTMADMARKMANAAGLNVTGEIAERIARMCVLDSRLVQSEIAKYALYLDASPHAPRVLDASTLDAVGTQDEDDSFAPLVNVVLGGELGRLAGELRRMREQGINPVGLLLAMERRVAQLSQLAARLGPRGRVSELMNAERAARRVNMHEVRDVTAQLERWRGPKLTRLVDRLFDLHRSLLANSQQQDILLAQGLTEIARAAARG